MLKRCKKENKYGNVRIKITVENSRFKLDLKLQTVASLVDKPYVNKWIFQVSIYETSIGLIGPKGLQDTKHYTIQ